MKIHELHHNYNTSLKIKLTRISKRDFKIIIIKNISKLIIDIAIITNPKSEQHKAKNLHLMFPFLIPSYSHMNIRAYDSKQYYFRHKYSAMRSYFRYSDNLSLRLVLEDEISNDDDDDGGIGGYVDPGSF